LREERWLRVFENWVLSRIFGPKRDEVVGEWRKLHNGELNDLYSSYNIVRVIKWRGIRRARHVARMCERRRAHRVLLGKPEGKRPLGSSKVRWKYSFFFFQCPHMFLWSSWTSLLVMAEV